MKTRNRHFSRNQASHGIRRALLIAALTGLGTSPLLAQAQEQALPGLVWLMPDFPPIYISSGPFEDQGIGDVVRQGLVRGMPQYQHQARHVSPPDFYHAVREPKSDETLCVPLMPALPRYRDYLVVSAVLGYTSQQRMLVDRRWVGKLPLENGQVSLRKLLEQTELRVAVLEGWGYLDLDPILASGGEQVKVIRDAPHPDHFIRLIHDGEVDIILASGYMAEYGSQLYPELRERLVALPIFESKERRALHAACRNTAAGKQAINAINQLNEDPGFRALVERNLTRSLNGP